MADSQTVQSLIDYYVNLLIVQYHGKPKARATIEAYVKEVIGDGILFDIRDAFSVDTAVGVQLDVIGKYVGVDRFYKNQVLIDFFALSDYDEPDPVALEMWGFSDYTDFGLTVNNGTLTYDAVVASDFRLSDDSFRTIIRLKIIQNYSNHSHESIDTSIFDFFGTDIIPDSQGDMHMIYFVTRTFNEVIFAAIFKSVLPRPMGVGLDTISFDDPFFGLASYEDSSPLIEGFTEYSTYDSKEGETLAYSKITRIA